MTNIAAVALAAFLFTSCQHSQVIQKDPSEVIAAAQSLAQWSNPPRYKTTQLLPDQEWSVMITEPVPGQKFEHHEITIDIKSISTNTTAVAITAFHVNSLLPGKQKKTNNVARQYSERLANKLNDN